MINRFFNLFRKLTKKPPMTQKKMKEEKSYLLYDWTPVINFETGGKAYYDRFLKRAVWPGGQSGVTIGIGADLGYMTKAEFDTHFRKYFSFSDANRLSSVVGIKGQSAQAALVRVSAIGLSWENAKEAFVNWTLPKFWKMSNDLWPGLNRLCEPAQVALVSVVFNRGASTSGPSRKEMLNIKPLVVSRDYVAISDQIISMKRLWIGKGLNGLLKRRDEEAKMVKSCAN